MRDYLIPIFNYLCRRSKYVGIVLAIILIYGGVFFFINYKEYSQRYDKILFLWRKEKDASPPPSPPNRTIKIGLFGV